MWRKFNFNKELLDNLTSSNNNINDILVGLQFQVDNTLKLVLKLNILSPR